MTCRTRFAPSPTGYLHIGGARTALYCWLYSKKHHGQFILRIEDTDKERSTQAAVQAILDAMDWLGMDYDEGPFYQSDRMDRYNEVLEQLLTTNHAYRCYCSKERLEKLRADQIKNHEKPRYDGHCRDLTDGDPTQPHVVRFRNPQSGEVAVDDLEFVLGEISKKPNVDMGSVSILANAISSSVTRVLHTSCPVIDHKLKVPLSANWIRTRSCCI